jgi:hypothetical protein
LTPSQSLEFLDFLRGNFNSEKKGWFNRVGINGPFFLSLDGTGHCTFDNAGSGHLDCILFSPLFHHISPSDTTATTKFLVPPYLATQFRNIKNSKRADCTHT